MARRINGEGSSRGLLLDYLSLFTSLGTLLCCALPSLLVLLGLGATVASFLTALPALVTLSRHKHWVFFLSGLMIGGNFIYTYWAAPKLRADSAACPADAPEACRQASTWSRAILWTSVLFYCIGLFSAYLLGPLLIRYGD